MGMDQGGVSDREPSMGVPGLSDEGRDATPEATTEVAALISLPERRNQTRGSHGPLPQDRQAIAELVQAEELWRLTIDNAPVGVSLVDARGRFLRVNRALCEMLGFTESELMQHTFQSITHTDDLDADLALVALLADGSIPSYRMQKRYLHKDGHPVWVELSVSLVRDMEGNPSYYIGHVQDIAERIAVRRRIDDANAALERRTAELERSNADLEQFAMVASHDLRAPLGVITGYLEMIQHDFGDELAPQASSWLDKAASAARRMDSLVEGLLDFAKSGQHGVVNGSAINLDQMLSSVVDDLQAQITAAGAQITLPTSYPLVVADEQQLHQVLVNLIQNAIKYASPDRPPVVEVAVEDQPFMWEFTVSDNGAGIADDHKEQVFEMFSRAGRESNDGHGIGLATCRRIIEHHGGQIWIEDSAEGGAAFKFTLPHRPAAS